MSSNLIKPGKYIAKVVEYGIPETKEGASPSIALTFEFEVEGVRKQLTYYGYLTSAAAEYTLKNLITAGFKHDRPSMLCKPNAFIDKEVQIVVEHETYEGKTRAKIRWINELGAAKWKPLTPEVAAKNFDHFATYIRGLRAELGKAKPQEEPPPPTEPPPELNYSLQD